MEVEIILKLVLAAVLGGIIGLERYITRRNTGLSSTILITVGSTLLTIIALKSVDLFKTDGTLWIAQIITAAGLLGLGAIVRERFSFHGLNAAAGIWIVAAIGITVGIGFYLIALLATVLIVIILVSLQQMANLLDMQHKLYPYIISVEDRAVVLVDIKRTVTELGIQYISATIRKGTKGYDIELVLNTSKNKNREFVDRIMQLPGVKEIISEYL